MRFKDFLNETPGDKNFIEMMNKILGDIPELKQKSTHLNKVVSDIASSIPGMIQKQKDLEQWMRAAVASVLLIPNTMLAPYIHELKGLENQYQENTSILDMLSFHLDFSHQHEIEKNGRKRTMSDERDEWTPIVEAFIKKHGDDLEDCIRAVDHGFEAIKEMADKEEWAISWKKVGILSDQKHIFHRMQEELLYWIKELRN